MTKSEKKIIIGLMDHFHEESPYYGGHPIKFAPPLSEKPTTKVIKKYFDGALKVTHSKNFGKSIELKASATWPMRAEAFYFKQLQKQTQEMADRYYDALMDIRDKAETV